MDALTNVESINFRFDRERKDLPIVYFQESVSKVGIPVDRCLGEFIRRIAVIARKPLAIGVDDARRAIERRGFAVASVVDARAADTTGGSVFAGLPAWAVPALAGAADAAAGAWA